MTDTDLIAAFLAKNGTTRVETGARAYDERSMYLAVRGEPVQSLAAKADAEEWAGYQKWEKDVQDAWEARHGVR
jgi:hypothetical protein